MLSVILVYLASGQLSDQATVAAIEAQVEALREQHAQQLQALLEDDMEAKNEVAQTTGRTKDQVCLDVYVPEGPWNPEALAQSDARERFQRFLMQGRGKPFSEFKGIGTKEASNNNVYMIIGWASQGIKADQMPRLKEEFKAWCEKNNKRHGDSKNWVVLSQGDGHYTVESLVTLFEMAKDECGVPVYVLQSSSAYNGDDWAVNKLDDQYNPYYAEALFFGKYEGAHPQNKNQRELKCQYSSGGMKWPNTRCAKDGLCWGGYCDLKNKKPEAYAFVDRVMFDDEYFPEVGALYNHLGGVFVAGNGAITADQCEIYDVGSGTRDGDADFRKLDGVALDPATMPSIPFNFDYPMTVELLNANAERM